MDHFGSDYARLDQVPKAMWETLSRKKIYFGHQSVGASIIDGIGNIMGHNDVIHLNIRETWNAADFDQPVLAHTLIGRNTDPNSKIAHFREILESGVGGAADIAMFKFCFVDFDRETDIESLFEHYAGTISYLKGKYPDLQIITWTVPLTTPPPGLRPAIKSLLGMMPSFKADNIQRNIFNEKVRLGFGKSLYDLANAEATRPDGRKVSFTTGGETFDLLNRAYSNDGGHLNALGSRVIAIDLLVSLANLFSA